MKEKSAFERLHDKVVEHDREIARKHLDKIDLLEEAAHSYAENQYGCYQDLDSREQTDFIITKEDFKEAVKWAFEQQQSELNALIEKWERNVSELPNDERYKIVSIPMTATANFILNDLKELIK